MRLEVIDDHVGFPLRDVKLLNPLLATFRRDGIREDRDTKPASTATRQRFGGPFQK